jgi:hypothetical protein
MLTRRNALQKGAIVGGVSLAGCLGSVFGPTEVDGIEQVAARTFMIELGENEYSSMEISANTDIQLRVGFRANDGNLAVLALSRQQFWEYEDGNNFEGYWGVSRRLETGGTRIAAPIDAGETFVVVADNTGVLDEHEVDGPTEGRIETQSRVRY